MIIKYYLLVVKKMFNSNNTFKFFSESQDDLYIYI